MREMRRCHGLAARPNVTLTRDEELFPRRGDCVARIDLGLDPGKPGIPTGYSASAAVLRMRGMKCPVTRTNYPRTHRLLRQIFRHCHDCHDEYSCIRTDEKRQ